ncbi:MAG: sugar phosphate nucleotidyltransferase [Methanolinea sp.]|jgi:glucose-1-phosphate thymidylyltransferase|nr:sugar phosphate nucleotidyltransferase [Methanolinea sp.]
MQAVILAAGEGKRLRPLTRSRPKALIPVGNTPVMDYVINALQTCGIRDIIVVVGYRKEQVIRHLNTLDARVEVVVQEKPLGTAHALLQAKDLLTDRFLVLPGDNFINSASIARIKEERNAVLVKEHPYPSNFGVVVTRRGYVTSIVEKPAQSPSFTISTGIFSLDLDFFSCIQGNDLTDAVGAFIKSGKKLRAVPADDWQDAIYPWDLLQMNQKLIHSAPPEKAGEVSGNCMIQGHVRIGKGTRIGPGTIILGPVVIGPECEIGPHACIMPFSSIGARVRVEPYTLVQNAIVMDDTQVGSHSRIKDTVIGEGAHIEDHVSTVTASPLMEIQGEQIKGRFGAILGEKVRAGPFTILEGAIVGNNVTIRGGSRIQSTMAYGDGVLVV